MIHFPPLRQPVARVAVEDNGNLHFATIFVDYSWSAGLYLCEDCHCLVFTQMRSHSSRALCARVSVCGGALRAAVVPDALRKGLSGGMGDERKKNTLQYSLYSSSLANTGIVKHRVQHFALKGWIRSEIIAM